MRTVVVVIILCFVCNSLEFFPEQDQKWVTPKIRKTLLADAEVLVFNGNQTHTDYFKLLERDGDSLLIGALNAVYNISLKTFEENNRLEWTAVRDHILLCKIKGKSDSECQNYIRVLTKKNDTEILVCGTNAFKPLCRQYSRTLTKNSMTKEFNGQGLYPYDPRHNTTAVFVENSLYSATSVSFSGDNRIIYREPVTTEQYSKKHLNSANFVSSMSFGDHVYFFFRETSIECVICEDSVYSRVARVCKNDKGGPGKFRRNWTSFLKARLNCTVSGNFSLTFDELQSTTEIIDGVYNGKTGKIIYAVFTNNANSGVASAVCAYRMQDISDVFDGTFKEQVTPDSNWVAVPNSKVPEPRPGKCSEDSTKLPESTLTFLRNHLLMHDSVPMFWQRPIVIQTKPEFTFTHIAVDPQVETVSGKKYDVLFIGTDDGRVLKAINALSYMVTEQQDNNEMLPVIVEDIKIFPKKTLITNLQVYRTTSKTEAKVVVVSNDEIRAIPLNKCESKANTCGKCVALRDPYCAWDMDKRICRSSMRYSHLDLYVQNIEYGTDSKCDANEIPYFSIREIIHLSDHLMTTLISYF